ncbi:NAD+ diphosphatase [Amycolatopsis arida]|uniref:NAD(+) diphosphatase n=1 Tax=Amycolatopsis arida TaxID=587909 RepID=A0A1I5WB43_9PSEU|nr:NAD(+) diphosphatase [Amycolatopsis arida]TDX92195.1 NAD+ diphosphatase [Amycolatopsis arida]SFQ16901.1 NAD+ diphosphatase [Amycolatopsis arida]
MSRPFELNSPPALSRSSADRAETLRADPERLRARWPDARVVLMDHRGRVPAHVPEHGPATLATRKALAFGDEPPAEAVFLGEWRDSDHWALPGEPDPAAPTARIGGGWGLEYEVPAEGGELWLDLRGHGDRFDDVSAGLLSTALALGNWHRGAGFCARCGAAARRVQFGWATRCESCGREEYPRTDPAVICLVHDDVGVNGEQVLLARQPIWPPGRYSVLAGFVEAGESLEGCVVREIREEVGVEVGGVRYLGSQPWPFPRSIMLGFAASADAAAPLRPADGEIEDARWVPREVVRAAFERGTAGAEGFVLPRNASIAWIMLRSWADAEP